QALNGQWSIGTDSHVSLDPLEELRLLDYGQRLTSHSRMTFALKEGDSGLFALRQALISGRKAMGNFNENFFAVGQKLNAVSYDLNSPLLAASENRVLVSTLVYSHSAKHASSTLSNGKIVSNAGQHDKQEEFSRLFVQTIA